MKLTVDHLRQIARARSVNDNMRSIVAGLDRSGVNCGLDRPHRLAQYLAQIGHESGLFKHDREVWGPTPAQARYDTRTDLGNTAARDGDGKKYAGRTGLQITGKANTKSFLDWCFAQGLNPPDFVASPDLMNTDPWEGLGPVWYWSTRKLNRYADQNDIEMITRRINGGLNGYADRLHLYTVSALVLLGHSVTKKELSISLKAFQAGAKAKGTYKGTLDGIDGPKTRAALHIALVEMESATAPETVSAGPVVQETEKTVPVAPKGAEKTLFNRMNGLIALATAPFAAFANLDTTGKLIVLGVGFAAIGFLLFKGELIAARAKSVLKAFGS